MQRKCVIKCPQTLAGIFPHNSSPPKKKDDTITYMLKENSRVKFDEILLKSLAKLDINENERNGKGFFVKRDFFKNIRVYQKMQRAIETFNNQQICNRRKVRNFNVVLIFSFRRQHVRIDKDVFYRIMANCGSLKVSKMEKWSI